MSARPATTLGGSRADGRAHRAIGSPSVLRACARLAEQDDLDLAVRFLTEQPAHAGRTAADCRHWARIAVAAGHAAASAEACDPEERARQAGITVTAGDGGLARTGWLVVAEYVERRREIIVYEDVLSLADRLTRAASWSKWYPPGSLRRAVIAHELGHRALHGERARRLRAELGLLAVRFGPLRRYGHVVGAAELFAHGYAEASCGLGRNPLLLTYALAVAACASPTGNEAA